MALVLPYPNKPANGDTLDATVVQANFTAIAQAIQSFDGSQIQASSVQAASLAAAANPITRGNETIYNFVYSGLVISNPSGLNVSISGGILYILGNRVVFPGVGSSTLGVNKDTYIDVDYLGNVTYNAVSNNTASPALTANSIRIGIVVSGAATISSFNQGSFEALAPVVSSVTLTITDTNGVLIYPTDPAQEILGYRRMTVSWSNVGDPIQVPQLSAAIIVPPVGRVEITANGFMYNNTVSSLARCQIWDGAVSGGNALQLGQIKQAVATMDNSVNLKRDVTLSAGLHTINVSSGTSGSGTTTFAADITNANLRYMWELTIKRI